MSTINNYGTINKKKLKIKIANEWWDTEGATLHKFNP